jgi:hypothetical protein
MQSALIRRTIIRRRGHAVVIRGHQRSSEAIRDHQRSPEVIRGNHSSSEVIRGRQRQSVDNQGSIRGNHGAKCDRYLDETLRRTPTTTPTTTPSHRHRRHRRHRRRSLSFGALGLAIKRRVEPQAGLLQTEEQSACNQHAISMQSACNQHAISMQSTGATFRRKSLPKSAPIVYVTWTCTGGTARCSCSRWREAIRGN